MADQHVSNPAVVSTLNKETPQLVALLEEMRDGLDAVSNKVQALTQRVKDNQMSTADGMSYLDAKNLLLLSYCQSIVYYLLRKARGMSINGHPVVKSLVEVRLFLEKIRPIDKKLEYQVQKLMKAADNAGKEKIMATNAKEKNEGSQNGEDPMKYRPNPDMLISKISVAEQSGGAYRPPKIAPTTMEEDTDKMSKEEKQLLRKQKNLLRQSERNPYMKDIMNDFQDRPEEIEETVGPESRELSRYLAKREEQARQEEDLFIRAPITKKEKNLEKHLTKSRNGLSGLTDGFQDILGILPRKDNVDNIATMNPSRGKKGYKKRKRNH